MVCKELEISKTNSTIQGCCGQKVFGDEIEIPSLTLSISRIEILRS